MSLHPRNIEPSEGTVYLTCSLAWLGKGWWSPQGGAQALSFLCAENTFFLLQAPSSALSCTLSCKCIFPSFGLDCPLTHPRFQHVLWTGWEFCCSLMLLFTQRDFSWFPTRACEWVAWGFLLLLFCFLSCDMGFGCLIGLETKGVLVLTLRQGPLFP